MMGISIQLILVVCIVYFGSTFVQPYSQIVDQTSTNHANDGSEINNKVFNNLFGSIAKSDRGKSEIFRKTLEHGASRGKQVFDTMKGELMSARKMNVLKRGDSFKKNAMDNIMVKKRETETPNPPTTSRITTTPPVDDSMSVERRFPIPITPITTINDTKVMKFVEDLWVSQRKFYNEIVRRTEVLCNKTNLRIKPIQYLFNEIDPLFRRQIRVLTKHPWEDTDEMYEALDYELLGQQIRSYNALGQCLTDHFCFPEENKAEERELRKYILNAKKELKKRRTTLVGMTNINFTMFKDPYSVEDNIDE